MKDLREEIRELQEPAGEVGEVVKPLSKDRILVKVGNEGKFIVALDKAIKVEDLKTNMRVALKSNTYKLYKILPTKVDPLVSLMKVEKVPDSTYDMVGGLDKQIEEVKDVIELPIKHPELYEATGISQPKGVLLYGPPGTGKTLLARAVAHHSDCTFIRVSGGELVQKYIGEGARLVRELFVMAKQHAPSIIFMDEIDSIGGKRGDSGRGDSEVQRTMLELLNQLDGFDTTPNVKIIMATNRIDILDPALLRPGRIDRKIEFPNPNAEVLSAHTGPSRHPQDPLQENEPRPRHRHEGRLREDARLLWRRVEGGLHRGGNVRPARAQSARHTGRLRDGRGQGDEERLRQRPRIQETVEIIFSLLLKYMIYLFESCW